MKLRKQIIALLAAALLCGSLLGQTDIELVTASYFGGFGDDFLGDSRTVNVSPLSNGGWVQGGSTTSFNFWTSGNALIPTRPGPISMTVTRFDGDGNPNYSTFLGGSSLDNFSSLGLLGDSVVVGGSTQSSDYPVSAGAHETNYPGVPSGVVTCLNPQGGLAWSTYFGGGAGPSVVSGVHVSTQKAIFITGNTHDPELATVGVHMETFPPGQTASAYIARFNSYGDLEWCTYYDRGAFALSSSPDGSRIYTYASISNENPTGPGSHQEEYGGGLSDAFLACFDAETGMLIWETFFGGEGEEWIGGVEVAEDGLIYITGTTWSAEGISTPGAHQEARAGDTDAFLACFEPNGQLLWGTYFGGEGLESSNLPKLRASSLYLAGGTNSPEGITQGNPVEPNMLGTSSSYLTKWNRMDGTLEWATYIGSTPGGACSSAAVEVLADGKLLLTGSASGTCPGFITDDAWQTSFGGGELDIWYAIYSESTLSTANSTSESGLRAFPNPVRDVLTIVRSGLQANDAYTLFEISGRVVMQGILSGPQAQVSVGHLPAGIYLLRVDGREEVSTLKIVKE